MLEFFHQSLNCQLVVLALTGKISPLQTLLSQWFTFLFYFLVVWRDLTLELSFWRVLLTVQNIFLHLIGMRCSAFWLFPKGDGLLKWIFHILQRDFSSKSPNIKTPTMKINTAQTRIKTSTEFKLYFHRDGIWFRES